MVCVLWFDHVCAKRKPTSDVMLPSTKTDHLETMGHHVRMSRVMVCGGFERTNMPSESWCNIWVHCSHTLLEL